MTLNEKNFHNHRKYSVFVPPEHLHAAIGDILAEPNLHEIYIQKLNVFDDGFFENDPTGMFEDTIKHEYWIQAEYGVE